MLYLIPILMGLIIALLILLIKPQWLPAIMTAKQGAITENHNSDPAEMFSGPVSYATAVNRAAPAVVNIFTQRIIKEKKHPLLDAPFLKRFFNNQDRPTERLQSSLGSGVIMNEAGYILTNHHVIAGADQIRVALHDGREIEAKLIGTDPEVDLAVLKINLPNLSYIRIAESGPVNIGDVVLAIGNPFGVGQTVTMGIISALGRNQLGLNTYEDYIQTDAAINPGNSGGALINAHGYLVGINAAIYSQSGGSQGIGFAIPANSAAQVLADITQFGKTVRGWMGIEVQEATPALLIELGLPNALEGLLVTGLSLNGPAQQSGLMIGDILTALNNKDSFSAKSAMNQIGSLRPGENISIDFIRSGRKQSTVAIAGKRQSPQPVK
ncbi:MAG: trypsin-like peptidase domain-containing protein [Oleispira sp.]|nr:trypsin-like peptidase domain-containing protein [Oleispira sp.]MBL4881020.1 trypsin-like peptidase domain-containing protein [Oleispira sp.]